MANENNLNENLRSFTSLSEEVSGLSKGIPLPNIVRIETLNKISRDRYLGTLQRAVNSVRDQISDGLKEKKLNKFYGFMKGNASKALELGSVWRTSSTSGGVLGFLRNIVGGGGAGAGGDLFGLFRDITGISASSTGSTTLKKFESTTLSGFTVNCGWYLPEQYGLCIKSLKSILAMTYPTQLESLTLDQVIGVAQKTKDMVLDSDSVKAATLAAKKLTGFGDPDNKSGETTENGENGVTAAGTSDDEQSQRDQAIQNKKAAEEQERVANINGQKYKDDRIKTDVKNTREEANKKQSSVDLLKISDFFGRNLTFDPLPVRCSIGHYIDIEPLVITKLSIDLSNDTFINFDGRHMPLFCSISITFDFWLNPAPKLQFMSLLGNEMFGKE